MVVLLNNIKIRKSRSHSHNPKVSATTIISTKSRKNHHHIFGERYYYWDNNINHQNYVCAKYDNLKDEIKDNYLNLDYEYIYNKVKQLIKTDIAKETIVIKSKYG